jgi:7,8-dihydropterin-6-yl-methyl-4-(beta-D-ribofuranosyl)aminobenzene 5'-phosphate synthase
MAGSGNEQGRWKNYKGKRMYAKAQIVVVADNTVTANRIKGEHGLAFWIETAEHCIMFDTGQGLVLEDNARALNLDLDAVDTVVLSHGHYDHTGGLASVLRCASGNVCIYAHLDAFLPKYHRKGESIREIGIPSESRVAMTDSRCRLIASREPIEIVPGVWSTGEILRQHREEASKESFCRDAAGQEPDLLMDDQALFIDTAKGMVVLLGCAHAGLINTLDHIQQLTNGRPIRAVVGGMHLGSASDSRLAWTISALRKFGIGLFGPMHCTGQKAIAAFWAVFPSACQECGVGTLFKF